MSIHLFFSNNIETLAASFSQQVSNTHDLFNPSTIIVPNPYLQKWLQLKIAETQGISINHKFDFLNNGLWDLLNELNGTMKKPTMLDQTGLQLLLYISLTGLTYKDRRVKPLLDYLAPDEAEIKQGYEKKAWQLSILLARYFQEYECYRWEMTRYWQSGKLVYNTEMELSQQYLYNMIFADNGLRDTVDPDMLTLPQYWDRSLLKLSPDANRTLFLFGKSQLSPFHIRMIYELGKFITIYMYQVNPCSEFWEDVTTPGEDRWKKIQSVKIEEHADGFSLEPNENENYLLKLWGKSGRETIKLLSLLEEAGSRELNTTSEWLDSDHNYVPDTCLHHVQDQILKRISPSGTSSTIGQDRSIQVAACPDIFRETETVYNSIIQNLKFDETLKMSDIAIMVPDMSIYAPVINSVFSRSPKQITYSIIDSNAAIDSLFGKAVNTLLDIAGGSFSRKTVFELIFNQCFLDAHDMDYDDANVCLSWTDSLNIFHTYQNTESINPELNLYTWLQGLQRLRLGRIIETHDVSHIDGIFLDYKNIVPYTDINTGNLTLLDTFICFIELLNKMTKDLQSLKASGSEWLNRISALIDTFIIIPSDRPEEAVVYATLLSRLKRLAIIDRISNQHLVEGLSFPFIKEFIQENIISISSTHGSYLSGGINISALVPKRQIPFKIIYVMGMQEGLFPGTADSSTLNLINIRRQIGDVSKPDSNRYLFLEAILSTRNKLYITYVSKDLQKDQDFFPNSVLGQFLTYLDNSVANGKFSIILIPPTASSQQYLVADSASEQYTDLISFRTGRIIEPTSFSLADRIVLIQNASRKYTCDPHVASQLEKKIFASIPDFSIKSETPSGQNELISISLRDLSNFLNNPAESILRWHLGIYEEDHDNREQNEMEPFFSIFPYSYRFINDTQNFSIFNHSRHSIEAYMSDYYRHARYMSATPPGAFGELDYQRMKSIITERIYGSHGISYFINARKNLPCYRNVKFGSMPFSGASDLIQGPMKFQILYNDKIITASASGLLPVLWKNPDNKECETLVITNSDKPTINHIIPPFLFYIFTSTGMDKKLEHLVGSGPFTIHVSYKKGIKSFTYDISANESLNYVKRLISDFLDVRSFDNLPLPIIFEHTRLYPASMKLNPDESDRTLYREMLAQYIDEDADKRFPSYRNAGILEFIDATIPSDAYDKVRDRLTIPFQPFIKAEARSNE